LMVGPGAPVKASGDMAATFAARASGVSFCASLDHLVGAGEQR